jgi:uncharacterized 2Fe-2S/4Fe-4S cluster protein (DUF4445 family)
VLNQPCGGRGTCRKCGVRLVSGGGQGTAADQKAFSPEELAAGWRLACQTSVRGPMTVDLPQSALLPSFHQILTAATTRESPAMLDPAARKQYVELPLPSLEDDASDTARLERALGPLRVDLDLLRELPNRLRECGFHGTAVISGDELIDFEPLDTRSDLLAVATDIGTTTLVGALLDLRTGGELAVTSRLNPQRRFGDDVLSRIAHASRGGEQLKELSEAVVGAVDEMIGELCAQTGVERRRIYDLTFAGNTTMQQLLCRVDPGPLGRMPFVPGIGRGMKFAAAELGLHIHPRGTAYILPIIGGFVGGDTTAGMLAADIAEAEGPTLFVDIGTNGEIVLCANGKLTAASTAAGPAFEGARISQGTSGRAGAIEKVVVDGRLRIHAIGDVRPMGICGSGLIDAAAVLLRHGLLSPRGQLKTPEELPEDALPDLKRRLIMHEGQLAFQLAEADRTAIGRPIVLTGRDIRELQLACGAIRAGIAILLRRAGLKPEDLADVWIGGGFGSFIRRDNAQRIGLLPWDVPRHRIRCLGNTSLAGARLTALSLPARQKAEDIARRTSHVDLATDREFQATFAESLTFPDEKVIS